ncbi:MAG: MlaD family protein [Xanthomonadales bacterium]|nr:MlaD family protein [Xanthomonadales bacterium]
MKRESINYLVAGSVVLAALALLLIVLYRITGRTGDTESYHAYYEQVLGVRYGTPVYFEGYRIGQVEAVVPEHEGVLTSFRVEMSIEENWPVPIDSIATISTSGILSDVFIFIKEGEAETTLSPGEQIQSEEAVDLFAALGNLAGEIESLAESELGPLIALVTERIDKITAQLEEGTPGMINQADELMVRLNASASSLQELLGDENRETLVRTFGDLERTAANAADLAGELRDTRGELHELIESYREIAAENRPEIRRAIAGLETTIDRLSRRIDSIAFNLEEASRHFNEFTREIRHQPNRLLFSPEPEPEEQ